MKKPVACSPNVPVIYKIKKYKYNYHRERYEWSWTKRMASFEECQNYKETFESATRHLAEFFGKCHRKEDIVKIEIITPNPYQPPELVMMH